MAILHRMRARALLLVCLLLMAVVLGLLALVVPLGAAAGLEVVEHTAVVVAAALLLGQPDHLQVAMALEVAGDLVTPEVLVGPVVTVLMAS